MKRILFFLVLYPCFLMAAHKVPMGTSGNQYIFTVKNDQGKRLEKVCVFVRISPSWISFTPSMVTIDSIPPGQTADASFFFDVFCGETGRTGIVEVEVFDENGKPLAERTLYFQADLDMEDSGLFDPFPNPGNPGTNIQFGLKQPARVILDVYNVLGRKVRTLLDDMRPAGLWQAGWDGRNMNGVPVSSGVYVLRIRADMEGTVRTWSKKVMIKK